MALEIDKRPPSDSYSSFIKDASDFGEAIEILLEPATGIVSEAELSQKLEKFKKPKVPTSGNQKALS